MKKLLSVFALGLALAIPSAYADDTGINVTNQVEPPTTEQDMPDLKEVIEDKIEFAVSNSDALTCNYLISDNWEFIGGSDACELSGAIDELMSDPARYGFILSQVSEEVADSWEDLVRLSDDLELLIEDGVTANGLGINSKEFRDYVEAKEDMIDRHYGAFGSEKVFDDYMADDDIKQLYEFYGDMWTIIMNRVHLIAASIIIINGAEALQKID